MGLKLQICFVILGFLISTMANPIPDPAPVPVPAANPDPFLGNLLSGVPLVGDLVNSLSGLPVVGGLLGKSEGGGGGNGGLGLGFLGLK
ncbi:hypothetical protein Anas_12163 [Armadillidium nasatum]|uniref:Uncharacterized protein n=1 Tax=Armadillidium nasatum TaxID=96803 RepID=A0A5N5T541_9CRUS|nr:hypothetical protein Anas_12163 [Armadillidium nasatum]